MHLYDTTIKPACAVAALFWVVGWVTVFGNFFTHHDVGYIGLGLIASACILQIRGYYLSIRKRFDDSLLDSEIRELRTPIRPMR